MASTLPAVPAAPDPAPVRPQAPTGGLGDRALVAITAAVTLPILWLGYGTDLDIGAVLRTGALIRAGDYAPSRNPGVPVVEAIVAALDPVGGHLLVNLATAAALAATVVGIARLVRAWGHANGDIVALAFLASPLAIISGTQTADFVWALGFLVWGALAQLRNRPVVAGVLFALALGSRSSTAVLLAAFVVADAWDRRHWRRTAVALAVAVPLAVACYVPAWLAANRTTGFLVASDDWIGLGNNAGRWAVKNLAVAGVPLVVMGLVAAPALIRSLGRWGRDPLVRFAVLTLAVTELLFLRMPWKPAHLLPAVLGLVLWVAASDRNRRPFLWLLVAAIAVNGLVTFRPLTSDNPDDSTSGTFAPTVSLGWVVNDVRCRARYMDERPHLTSGAWACTLAPMRGSG